MIRLLGALLALLGLVAGQSAALAQSMSFPTPSNAVTSRPYASGGYYQFDGPQRLAAGTASGVSVGMLRITPAFLHGPVTISEIGTIVTTAAAGGNFQIVLYASNPVTNMPTGTPLIQTANLSTATAGAVKATGLSKALPAGLYWCGVQADNTTAAFTAFPADSPFVGQVAGVQSGNTFGINAGSTNIDGLFRSGTFNAPPALTGSFSGDGLGGDVNAIAAACFFRAA